MLEQGQLVLNLKTPPYFSVKVGLLDLFEGLSAK